MPNDIDRNADTPDRIRRNFQRLADLLASGIGSGTVTSVGLSMPGEFSVSGSPVTSAGTLTAAWNTQAANRVLAGPTSGGAAAPTFRNLVAGDIPTLDASKINTGTFPVARGGTGINSFAQGDLIYASSATTLTRLGKNITATRYLANTGASNNPAWDLVNLTNGVTGTLSGTNVGRDGDSIQLDGSNLLEVRKLRSEATDPASPVVGEVWVNTTENVPRVRTDYGDGNLIPAVFEGLGTATNSDVVGGSTTAETTFTLSGSPVQWTVPANTLRAGHVYRVTLFGRFNAGAATTVRIKIKFGSTVIVFDSDSFNPFSTSGAQNNIPFGAICIFRVITTGATGTARSGCYGFIGASLTPTLGAQSSLDTTVAQNMTVTVQYGTSHANNGAFINTFSVEALGNAP